MTWPLQVLTRHVLALDRGKGQQGTSHGKALNLQSVLETETRANLFKI